MTLKVAFAGPNLTLNQSLVGAVVGLLNREGLDIFELPHPLVKVAEVTKRTEPFDGHDVDWMNLWSGIVRRMELEGTTDPDVIVSASCGLDNVCLQAAWMGEQVEKAKTGLSLVDSKGQPIMSDQSIWINRSGAVLQTILNSTEEEFVQHWDFVYAVVPPEVSVGATHDPVMIQYRDFLASVPVFADVVQFPDNLDAATDALKNEVEKWTAKLDS